MKKPNNYPVLFKDFIAIVKPGNYILTYSLLDDRIHLEFSVDNSVYSTQRFYSSIIEEFKEKGGNYTGSKMKLFLDQYFNTITAYRYYATEQEIKDLKTIKLYTKLKVIKSEKTKTDMPLAIIEYDDKIEAIDNEGKKILIIEKVN